MEKTYNVACTCWEGGAAAHGKEAKDGMTEESRSTLTLDELLHAADASASVASDHSPASEPVSPLLLDLLGGKPEEPVSEGPVVEAVDVDLEQFENLPRIPASRKASLEALPDRPAAMEGPSQPAEDAAAGAGLPDEETMADNAGKPTEDAGQHAEDTVAEEAERPVEEEAVLDGELPGEPAEEPSALPLAEKALGPTEPEDEPPVARPFDQPAACEADRPVSCDNEPIDAQPQVLSVRSHSDQPAAERAKKPVPATPSPAVGPARDDQLRALRQQLERRMKTVATTDATPSTGQAADRREPRTDTPIAAGEPASDPKNESTGSWPISPRKLAKGPAHARPQELWKLDGLRLKAALATVLVLVLIAVPLAVAAQLAEPSSPDQGPDASSAALVEKPDDRPSTSGRASEAATGGADANGKRTPGSEEDRSGTVVYRYATQMADGEQRTVTETVRFGKSGLCEMSTMEATFADSDAADAFIDVLRRDYGPAFSEGTVEGSSARATLDIAAHKLDREEYEDALRDSVEDLSIIKKS